MANSRMDTAVEETATTAAITATVVGIIAVVAIAADTTAVEVATDA